MRLLSHGVVGGIHTFEKNLLAGINDLGAAHEFVIYVDSKCPAELPSPLAQNLTVRTLRYNGMKSTVQHDMRMQRAMERDGIDVHYFAANVGFGPRGRTVLTLHDEINILPMKSIFYGHDKAPRTMAMMAYLHYASTAAVRRADLVVTMSEYTRGRILKYSGLEPDRLVVVPHGCPLDLRRVEDPDAIAEVARRLQITRPYILADAFKNPDLIVSAWQLLPAEVREAHQIVFYCRSNEVRPSVSKAVEQGWAQLFVRIPRADQMALYSGALAFVFPSWIEGFGIPLVEAMTCGAPIVASDRAAIPEVVGDAGILIDAEDDVALKDNLIRLFESPGERERLRALGLARSRQFTWGRAAASYVALFERIGQRAGVHQAGAGF